MGSVSASPISPSFEQIPGASAFKPTGSDWPYGATHPTTFQRGATRDYLIASPIPIAGVAPQAPNSALIDAVAPNLRPWSGPISTG